LRKYLQLLVGIAISAFFIWLTLPGLHLAQVLTALRSANYIWIVPGVLVYFVGLWARTWRWHYTLHHLKPVSLRRLFPLVCIGYFGNNVYPFRAGEVLRSFMLKRKEGIPISSSLATVLIERIFDGLTMLLFVFLALPFAPLPPVFRNIVILTTGLFVLATLIFVWLAVQPQRAIAFYRFFSTRLLPVRIRSRFDDVFERFIFGLRSLGSGSAVLMIFATSIVIWLMETVKYWFVMHAFPFHVSFIVLMLINGLVNLATTLPSAPGYIGTFDTPGIQTLVAFGVDANLAASYIFTLHAALWLPVTLVGAWYFWREQLHWSDFDAAQHSLGDEHAPAQSAG
jgi:glycosyltransferase 2 family protein